MTNINRSEPTWENQLWHAERIYQERGRDALNNPHAMTGKICGCGNCFCCAALAIVKKHDSEALAQRVTL